MPEIKTEVRTFLIEQQCGVNGCLGMMLPHGGALLTHPTKYPHRCQVCQREEIFLRSYPYTQSEKIEAKRPDWALDANGTR